MKKVRRIDPKRKIDILLDQYADSHRNATNILIHWFCVPLLTFGIFGLIWSIPFPYLSFLGKFNGFVNWASFTVGVTVYYYMRLSPTLSYGMLLTMGIFSFFIVQLEYLEIAGGPAMWFMCLLIFVISWIGQFLGHKIEGNNPFVLANLKFVLIGPVWLLSQVYKKLKIPY